MPLSVWKASCGTGEVLCSRRQHGRPLRCERSGRLPFRSRLLGL